jgi:anti-sigma factor RsiW
VTADCRDLRPLLGAYVLGALEAEEAAAVRAHVAACPACAAEHARLAPLPGLLTLAAGAVAATAEPPPAALEERLLDAIAVQAPRRRRRRRRPRRLRLLLGGAVAALAVAAGTVGLLAGGEEPARYDVKLQASAAAPRASARAELEPVPGGTAMHLWVSGLPRDADAVYEVRCDSGSWSASAGTFRVGPDGKAYVVLTTAARRGGYDAIRVVRRSDDRVVLWAGLS